MENSRKNEILKIIIRINQELDKENSLYNKISLQDRLDGYIKELKTA